MVFNTLHNSILFGLRVFLLIMKRKIGSTEFKSDMDKMAADPNEQLVVAELSNQCYIPF